MAGTAAEEIRRSFPIGSDYYEATNQSGAGAGVLASHGPHGGVGIQAG
jgi:hypothetical protein